MAAEDLSTGPVFGDGHSTTLRNPVLDGPSSSSASASVLISCTSPGEEVPTSVRQFLDYSDLENSDNLVDLPLPDPAIYEEGGGCL